MEGFLHRGRPYRSIQKPPDADLSFTHPVRLEPVDLRTSQRAIGQSDERNRKLSSSSSQLKSEPCERRNRADVSARRAESSSWPTYRPHAADAFPRFAFATSATSIGMTCLANRSWVLSASVLSMPP